MPFPIDLQTNMARTQRLVKKSDFFTNGLILVIHTIYQLLVMIWKLLHHLEHPNGQLHVQFQVQVTRGVYFSFCGEDHQRKNLLSGVIHTLHWGF